MSFYLVQPEVPGELGEHTVMIEGARPPQIEKLHFVVNEWLGDDIVDCFPAILVTPGLKSALEQSGLQGFSFRDIEQTVLQTSKAVPTFFWMVLGATANDFYIDEEHTLNLSGAAYTFMQQFALEHAEILRKD